MPLTTQEPVRGSTDATHELARALKRHEGADGPELERAWRLVDGIELIRKLTLAAERGRGASRTVRALVARADALINAVVDHALAARVYRDIGDGDAADRHAFEVGRRGRVVLRGGGGKPPS